MKSILHKADTRGHANHGWLDTHHTFSFAGYYDPERIHFGALRVLNDDIVDPGMGFGQHPHDNMEIISIPLEGELEHKDSMGNTHVIREGDVQIMSAGTGISHSERNGGTGKTNFLQIWVIPKLSNVTPRYDQKTFTAEQKHNKLVQVLSPKTDDEGVMINQDAWFHLGNLDQGFTTTYTLKKEGNGVYFFVLNGEIKVEEQALSTRDGLGVWETDSVTFEAKRNAELLLMEVPMAI